MRYFCKRCKKKHRVYIGTLVGITEVTRVFQCKKCKMLVLKKDNEAK